MERERFMLLLLLLLEKKKEGNVMFGGGVTVVVRSKWLCVATGNVLLRFDETNCLPFVAK
jgi:hypothetical protein